MNATDVIWYDPLNYDPLRDGPPYLPNQGSGKVASSRAWLKEAHAMMGQDVLVAFQHCTAEYGNAPMAELAVVLACFRAEAMIHQAHHWQTRGSSYYGDHLLFERVYGEVNGFIDRIAERAVGSGQEILVQPLMQISHMVAFSKLFYSDAPVQPTPEEMPLLSLRALLKSSLLLQVVYTSLEQKGLLSNGTDNLLQDVADKQESLSYLLKQRSKKARTMNTLKAFEHEILIRRVASRYAGASKVGSLPNPNVAPTAEVSESAQVTGNAQVSGKAKVMGSAKVYGDARIGGTAILLGGSWDGSEGPITEGRWKSPGVPD